MADQVYMNIEMVDILENDIQSAGRVLEAVSKKLDTLLTFLKTNAWVGQVGGRAVEQWLSDLKPQLANLSQRCFTLADKVHAAIQDYRQGDHLGSSHFVGATRTLEG